MKYFPTPLPPPHRTLHKYSIVSVFLLFFYAQGQTVTGKLTSLLAVAWFCHLAGELEQALPLGLPVVSCPLLSYADTQAESAETWLVNLPSTNSQGGAPSLPWCCKAEHIFHMGTQIVAIICLMKWITTKNLFWISYFWHWNTSFPLFFKLIPWLCCLPLAGVLRNVWFWKLSSWCPEIADWQVWPWEWGYSGVIRLCPQLAAQTPTEAHVITSQTNGLLWNTPQHPLKLCYLTSILYLIPRKCEISGLLWVFWMSSQHNSKQLLKWVHRMCLE